MTKRLYSKYSTHSPILVEYTKRCHGYNHVSKNTIHSVQYWLIRRKRGYIHHNILEELRLCVHAVGKVMQNIGLPPLTHDDIGMHNERPTGESPANLRVRAFIDAILNPPKLTLNLGDWL